MRVYADFAVRVSRSAFVSLYMCMHVSAPVCACKCSLHLGLSLQRVFLK